MFTGLTTIAAGSALYAGLCTIAVLFGWLSIRLWVTYLPAQANDVARLDKSVGEAVAAVQRAAGELPQLEERVRRTAQAVLPSVVAVRNPFQKPSEVGHHQDYASGVIITAHGVVLTQWHVSHWKSSEDGDGTVIRWGSSPTGSTGDRTTVILHDGRECPAELLGANRTHDVSLLRLLEPGPYPHVPIRATAPVEVGDWVLKIGHPLGYRKGRSASVRLGRVICGTEEFFATDCMMAGGDSGGPYFSLDGQLLGVIYGSGVSFTRVQMHAAHLTRLTGGWGFAGARISLVDRLMNPMRRGEVSPWDTNEDSRFPDVLATGTRLQAADFSQGSATLARYRSIVAQSRSSVVVVLNGGAAVSLGTIVGADGWVLTKSSELPGQPMCRFPDGEVVAARVAGVDPASDLALLSVPTTDLKPVRWADDFNPPVGTLLAAVGTEPEPLAVGVVSVPRRDLGAPVRPTDTLPLRSPAGRPDIDGIPRPISGYSLRAAFGLPRATVYCVENVYGLAYSAGVRPDDLLYRINGYQILDEEGILAAVNHRRAGDVVPVRLERAGKMMDLLLPLAPKTLRGTNYRADYFPTVIECAVPFYFYECGGPIVDLTGRAIGVTIARPGPHGGMVIPGDCVLKLLPELQSGRLAENWAPVRPPGK
jgi:serine protease Do